MKTAILLVLSISVFIKAQGELDIKPSNVDFKDEFHRIESVELINKEDQILQIDSISFKKNLFFITFDRPISFPYYLSPDDTVKMDITLTNYFTVTSADTADTISFFTSNIENVHLRVRIRFFDDDENYGILSGKISNDSLSVEETKIYLFRDGLYLFDSLLTDLNGNFSTILPAGSYTAAAFKEGYYFTYYKNQWDIYNADHFIIEEDSTTSVNWSIEKIVQNNSIINGKVIDSGSMAPARKGIVVVRKGKHTPTKRSLFSLNFGENFSYSTTIKSNGAFSFENIIEPGYYYIQAFPDFYAPSYANNENLPALRWQDADSVLIGGSPVIKDIFTVRDSAYGAGNISGQIFINSNPALNRDFILFAENLQNNTIANYDLADSTGNFNIINLPFGDYKLNVYQFGNQDYESQESYSIDPIDFSITGIEINLIVNSIKSNYEIPNTPILFPNYPNPFNPSTKIQLFLPQKEKISLDVFDILGKKIKSLYDGILNTGLHNFTFDGSRLSSGIYFIRLETSTNIKTQKALLIK